ncbi:phosphorylase family protein [Coprobacter sp.]
MKKICFVVAMEGEAKPLIRHFGLRHIGGRFGQLPSQAYEAFYAGKEITLITNGVDSETGLDYIGCEAAVLSAHLAISSFPPDLIINAGTAGGFASKGAQIGDVYLSDRYVVFHDRRVAIPGWDKMGQGYLPCADCRNIASRIRAKLGVCTSGSSLDITEEDLEQMKQTGGEVKDMEAAAIAWVASLYHIPLLCVKAITDLVDTGHPTPEQFNDNFLLATQRLDDACFRLIDEKLIDEL